MSANFVILGNGGHAQVVADVIRSTGGTVAGVCAPDHEGELGSYIGNDAALLAAGPQDRVLANGIGSIGNPTRRIEAFHRFHAAGFTFPPLVHPRAYVAADVVLGEGTQIMAAAVVQAGARIGRNALINTGACVDHHADIGDHVHIAPGAVLSGEVLIGEATHIGTGAVVVQSLRIGARVLIGAGMTVLSDVPDGMVLKAAKEAIWRGPTSREEQ